jgi:hypothetical protein
MKKLVLTLVLLMILSVSAFAGHPSGWGIGIVGQYNLGWDGFDSALGAALSLKTPKIPLYWGINLNMRNNYFSSTLTGDYYFLDSTLVNDVNFGCYVGIGFYAGFYHVGGDNNYNGLGAGARLPIGIYIIPVKFFEVFLDVAPSLGLGFNFGDEFEIKIPSGGLGLDIGFRFWI